MSHKYCHFLNGSTGPYVGQGIIVHKVKGKKTICKIPLNPQVTMMKTPVMYFNRRAGIRVDQKCRKCWRHQDDL